MTHANDIYKQHSEKLNRKSDKDKVEFDNKQVDREVGTTNFEEKVKRFKSQYNN